MSQCFYYPVLIFKKVESQKWKVKSQNSNVKSQKSKFEIEYIYSLVVISKCFYSQ